MVPFREPQLPDMTGVPVLVAAGRADPLVPAEETVRLGQLLHDAGAAVAVTWHDGGHMLTDASVRAARTWLRLSGLVAP
jgi:predicted esterase